MIKSTLRLTHHDAAYLELLVREYCKKTLSQTFYLVTFLWLVFLKNLIMF